MVEADKPDPKSPLYTLASVSAELLKDVARETVPTPAQGTSLEIQVPSVDLEMPSRELSPHPDPKYLVEPFTPKHPTLDQLTQELA